MKILVTGGAGFIGSHLAEALITAGHEVCIIDDLSTGSKKNIEHLKLNCTYDSIMNLPVLKGLVEQCDIIFHLAAAVGVRLIVDSPVHTIETNIRGTELLLAEACKEKKLVVLASTSEVYGKSNNLPFKEESDILLGPATRTRWSYACSKLASEFLALAYHKEKGLPVIITRLFNTIGPRQTGRYGMVVPRFIKQALAGEPLTVYGDGTQTRSFSYVGDIVDALVKLADTKKAVGEIFNIGSTEEVSIIKLARKVLNLTKTKSKIKFVPYEEAYADDFEDMDRRVPDISKINRLIGFTPKTGLDSALKKVIKYCESIKED